jgi:hypothetical protein
MDFLNPYAAWVLRSRVSGVRPGIRAAFGDPLTVEERDRELEFVAEQCCKDLLQTIVSLTLKGFNLQSLTVVE